MKWVLLALLLIACLAVLWDAYVRLAPSDLDQWNVALEDKPVGDYPGPNSFEVRRAAGPGVLGQLDAIALATPRTERLGGDLTAGPVTWITRSAVWGFPDYTTVMQNEDVREFYLGFGKTGHRRNMRDVKHYKRRKRWLS